MRARFQSESAFAVAGALAAHPAVSKVNYPGLASHPGHETARRQMSAFGSMISFHVGAGTEAAIRAVGKTRLFTRATSLGGVESLVEHRATSEGPASTAPGDLIRLSIGLEHPDDLLADLVQALGGLNGIVAGNPVSSARPPDRDPRPGATDRPLALRRDVVSSRGQ